MRLCTCGCVCVCVCMCVHVCVVVVECLVRLREGVKVEGCKRERSV